jgi:hypothetical protein
MRGVCVVFIFTDSLTHSPTHSLTHSLSLSMYACVCCDGWLQLDRRSGLLVHLFGKDGNGTCTYDQFCTLLRQLQQAVLVLEFNCHDVDDDNTISAQVRSPTHSLAHAWRVHAWGHKHTHARSSLAASNTHTCVYVSLSLSRSLSCCVGLQRTLRAQWSRMLTALCWSSSASALPPWATALVRTTGTVPTVGRAGLFWSVAVPGGRGGTVCVWVGAFASLCAHACLPASVPVCSVVTDDTWACMCLRPGQSGRVSGL